MNRDVCGTTCAWAAVVLAGAILTACGAVSEKAAPPLETQSAGPTSQVAATERASPLEDTEWRLVGIQSMDDAVGTTRPDDPSLYTMRLQGDGTVAMRLNCNRATGSCTV
jgi:hypothetical protein